MVGSFDVAIYMDHRLVGKTALLPLSFPLLRLYSPLRDISCASLRSCESRTAMLVGDILWTPVDEKFIISLSAACSSLSQWRWQPFHYSLVPR